MVLDLWFKVNSKDEKVEYILFETSLQLSEKEIDDLIVKHVHKKYRASVVGYHVYVSMDEYQEALSNLTF